MHTNIRGLCSLTAIDNEAEVVDQSDVSLRAQQVHTNINRVHKVEKKHCTSVLVNE